jgi:alkylhydroperoxidase family enzyme
MSHGDHLTTHRGAVRFLALALGIPQALIGIWALFAPRSFYDGFPAGTGGWVHVLGPFDEHLVTDVGALFVGLGFLMVFAAVTLRRGTVLAAAVTWLLFAVPHAVFHFLNLEPYGTADAIANAATLTWTVLGGIAILALVRSTPSRRATAGSASTGDGGMRLAGVPDGRAGLIARGTYSYSRKSLGSVPLPTRIYAHHPTILMGYGAVEMATQRADRLPDDLKHLVATKAAALAGCEWCMDFGSMLSAESGITEAKLRALPHHRDSSEFSEVEKLALDFTVAMTKTPVDVSDDLFARLAEHLDEAQLVELVHEIALENYRARFNWAFGIGAQGYREGAYCVRPETGAGLTLGGMSAR